MGEILAKIIAADVIIWSFPLYCFAIPGSLKTLIDRQLPLNLPFMANDSESGGHPARYDLARQRHIVISTCGFWTAEGNYDAVSSMFDRYFGKDGYAAIFCGQGELFRVPELKNRTDAYLEIVRRAGGEYARGGIEEVTLTELKEPLYPRKVFEKMADASWAVAAPEKDGGKTDDSHNFTVQMAALYQPDERRRVLEFCYTDINKTYQILLTENGSEVISDSFEEYTTRIETPYSVWRAISRGEISGQEALFQKLYKVSGDFEIMLRWDELFGAYGAPTAKEKRVAKKRQKPNLMVLLFPWLVIWILLAIDKTVGAVAGIVAAASLPFAWLVFKPVIFERISILAVSGLSLAILLGADARGIVCASYGLFGLMWFIGAFLKLPLTSYYSASGYGGSKAFENPLFIRTNRILTAAWGVLYLVTPLWTYVIMGTEASAYIGLINSACPAFMGIFTAWFQKWYPKQWARG
jgi:hypothetical protein